MILCKLSKVPFLIPKEHKVPHFFEIVCKMPCNLSQSNMKIYGKNLTLIPLRNKIDDKSKKRRSMNISKFKKEISLCTVVLAIIVEIISLPIIGWNTLFVYGLAIGTVVAIINTNILSKAVEKAVENNKRKYIIITYILRMVLYGGAFALSLKTANIAGLGTAIGFFLPQISMHIVAGLFPKIRKWRGLEEEFQYATDESRRVYEKKPWIELYHNGRKYKSHKRFRIVKRVPVKQKKEQ